MKLIQKLVGIPSDQLRELKAIAKRNGVKTSHIIRVAIKRYLSEVLP
jgi:metal-responsive CopG/Arc/MetJ family transcriptional regulator